MLKVPPAAQEYDPHPRAAQQPEARPWQIRSALKAFRRSPPITTVTHGRRLDVDQARALADVRKFNQRIDDGVRRRV